MRLYIIRHGQSEARAKTGRDQDRELTEFGQRQATWLGEQILATEKEPSLVLHSPFVRAAHTAKLVCDSLESELQAHDSLICETQASAAVDLIGEFAECEVLAFVGHNPQLEQLLGVLLGGPGGSSIGGLRTGEVVVLQVDPLNPVGTSKNQGRLRLEG